METPNGGQPAPNPEDGSAQNQSDNRDGSTEENRAELRLRGKARERLKRLREERDAKRNRRALEVLRSIREDIIRGMTDFILRHQKRLKQEFTSTEEYGFAVQKIEETYLTKLASLERMGMELDGGQSSHDDTESIVYESIIISGNKKEIPSKLVEALATREDAELLDAVPLNADGDDVELLLLMTRDDAEAEEDDAEKPKAKDKEKEKSDAPTEVKRIDTDDTSKEEKKDG